MINPINVQNHVRSLQQPGGARPSHEMRDILSRSVGENDPTVREGRSFGEILADSIQQVNELQADVDVRMEKIAAGEAANVHETLLEVQRAEMSMQMLLQVRNKLVSAYQEIMRLQV